MYLKNETTAVKVLCSSPYGRNTFHKWHLGGLLIYIVWNEVFTLKTHLTQEQNMLGVAFKRHHMSHQSLTSTVHLYHYDHEHAHELRTSNKRRSAVQRTSSWGESKKVPTNMTNYRWEGEGSLCLVATWAERSCRVSWEGQKSADICSRRDPHLGSEPTKIKKFATKAVGSIWLPHNCILLHHKYVQGSRPASLMLSRKRKIFGCIVYLIP